MTVSQGGRRVAVLPAIDGDTAKSVEPGGGSVADFQASVRAAGGVVSDSTDDAEGLVWLSYTDIEGFNAAVADRPQLRWVQLPWAGVDAFLPSIRAFDRPGRVWTSAKGAYAAPVAEHALALTLAMLREIPRRVRATGWDTPSGLSLHGRSVVIVGAGGIARSLRSLLRPFDVHLTVVRRQSLPFNGADAVLPLSGLNDALAGADVVILAASLTAETRELMGSHQFRVMKPTAYLVNVARGALVDQDALVDALRGSAIAGAAIDVTVPEPLPNEHPLWGCPGCLITPHSSNTAAMKTPLLQARIVENVAAFLRGGEYVGVVDPERGY